MVAGGVVLLLAALFFLQVDNKAPSVSLEGKVTYRELDKVRRNEEVRAHLQREKVNVENYKKAPQISESYRVEAAPETGLRLEASVGAAAKDIAESELQGMATNSLENRINQKLLNDQKAAQMSQMQKRQFAAEYKKKALAMGYQVELNDKLEITKVHKVESPNRAVKSSPVIDVDSMEDEDESFE